ncbi:hypothetical protein SEA_GANCHO_53 [Mycobacterium phage Gancho]|uniref:Uncharacterized protein n=1 Tax=Mycobacterium phage Gancho TaxID=2301613 RepID=A0A385UER4_9CAUD|nr:hypothetical protein SEA_GANCHO_53 [Mycobacterium phage Gancho]
MTTAAMTRHRCPVCGRRVAVTDGGMFRPHVDGIKRPCPMTGEPLPKGDGS